MIAGARQLLATLAHLPEFRSSDSAACNTLSAKLAKQYQYYVNLGAIRPNGDLSCSALPFRGRVNVADRLYFRRALETRDFAIGEYQIGRVTKKATVNFGYPVLDEEGRVQAVAFAALDLAWLNQLVAKAELPPGSVLTVTDHKGTILVRYPDPEKWVGQSMPEAPIVKVMLTQREGTAAVSGLDGVPRLFAFMPLYTGPAGGVASAVGIPKEAAFAEVNRILARNLALLGLVTSLALGAAWFGGDLFIRRRVNALVEATRRLAAGELSARTGIASGEGELDHLARAFDVMAEGLERHVAERTRAADAL
ncbi:MAG: HAMP domain-containing protein, partial [Anaerolineales bacterium]